MLDLKAKQEELELEMFGNGIERFNANNQRALDAGSASETDWYRRLASSFVDPYSQAIQAYIDYYTGRPGKPSKTVAYLKMLPTRVAAYVAIKVLFDNLVQDGQSAQAIAEKIGRKIEDQVRFTRLEDSAPKYVEAIKEGLKKNKSQSYNHAHKVMVATEKKLAGSNNPQYVNDVSRWVEWPKTDTVQLGAKLADIFINIIAILRLEQIKVLE